MGVRSHEDLAAFRLAVAVRNEVVREAATAAWEVERRFRDQLRRAAASPAANIAEGFGRFAHRDFARFLVIARGSLHETQVHLDDALARGYFEPAVHARLKVLVRRSLGATVRLLRYLQTTETPGGPAS